MDPEALKPFQYERYRKLPLDQMTHEQKVDELYECLTRLWGGGGEYGVYTVANERDRLKDLLRDLLPTPPRQSGSM